MQPTSEQQAIIDAAVTTDNSLVVNALAGAAKTTTLVMIANALAAKHPDTPILALAFNARIKEEMARKLPKSVTCLTLNGLGHRAWMRHIKKGVRLETRKTYEILKAYSKDTGFKFENDEFSQMMELIGSCKTVGLVPTECEGYSPCRLVPDDQETWNRLANECDLIATPTVIKVAKAALIESIRQAFEGVIDFDDQIYMSVCFNASYPKFKIVLVDEAQDLSSINHKQVVKAIEHKGRTIVVGDRHQSIYAFRGADPLSIDRLSETFNCQELELTTTFRCDKAICEKVKSHVPHIKHRHDASEGEVSTIKEMSIKDLEKGSAILCRNNAPLIALASTCMKNGIGVRILGREVGKGLTRILKKLPQGEGKLETKIERWASDEIQTAVNTKNTSKAKRIEDQRDCLLGLIGSNPEKGVEALCDLITEMFSDKQAQLTFATGHKSKGLEFDTVYHLNPHLINARNEEGAALTQEQNLEYVINTRAKHRLFFVKMDSIEEMNTGE